MTEDIECNSTDGDESSGPDADLAVSEKTTYTKGVVGGSSHDSTTATSSEADLSSDSDEEGEASSCKDRISMLAIKQATLEIENLRSSTKDSTEMDPETKLKRECVGKTKDKTREDIHGECLNRSVTKKLYEDIDRALSTVLSLEDRTTTDQARVTMSNLRKLLTSKSQHCEELIRYTLQAVYRLMETHRSDGFLQERIYVVLAKIARIGTTAQKLIATTGGTKHIIETMVWHKKSAVVQQRAVSTLLSLTSNEYARASIMSDGGAERICWAMNEYCDVKSIQIHGATALCNIAFGSEENKEHIGKIGGIQLIVNAMNIHAYDKELQARCCLALRNLTCGIQVNRWIAGQSGAVDSILRALELYSDVISIQYQGCAALTNICTDESDNRKRAVDQNCIPVVLTATKRNIRHIQLCEHGIALLRTLSIDSIENREKIGIQGGIRVVVVCMKTHGSEMRVLEKGCSALRYLLFTRPNRIRMSESEGIETLISILKAKANVTAIVESAMFALGNALFGCNSNKTLVVDSGGIGAIVDAMSKNIDNAVVQEHGCRALRNLADSNKEICESLFLCGPIKSVVLAMMAYLDNPNVQEHCCAMLFNVAKYYSSEIAGFEGVDVEKGVRLARAKHQMNQRVQCNTSALLDRMKVTKHPVKTPQRSILVSWQGFGLTKGSG